MSEWVIVSGEIMQHPDTPMKVKQTVCTAIEKETTLEFIYEESIRHVDSVRIHDFKISMISCVGSLDVILNVLKTIPGHPSAVAVDGWVRV